MSKYIYSLIIPHYNNPKLLRRLLFTIPKREDLQVIVIDDCSTSDLDELDSVKNDFNWVEWYNTGTNGGGGKTRNIGLQHAKGKYLIFADSDDFFTPGLSTLLDKYKGGNFDMVIFRALSLDSETFRISTRNKQLEYWFELYSKNKQKAIHKIKYVFGEPWCRIISKAIVQEHSINFQETLCHNDTKFSYLTGHYCKTIIFENIVGYVVTTRLTSVIYKDIPERDDIVAKVFSEKEQFFIKNKISESAFNLYTPIVTDFLKFKFKEAKEKYDIIKRYDPGLPKKKNLIKYCFKIIFYQIILRKGEKVI